VPGAVREPATSRAEAAQAALPGQHRRGPSQAGGAHPRVPPHAPARAVSPRSPHRGGRLVTGPPLPRVQAADGHLHRRSRPPAPRRRGVSRARERRPAAVPGCTPRRLLQSGPPHVIVSSRRGLLTSRRPPACDLREIARLRPPLRLIRGEAWPWLASGGGPGSRGRSDG